jgi:peptide/nickel transport system permease protein
MRAYIIRRILQVIPVLFFTSVFIFMLLRLIPGDPALMLAGPGEVPEPEVVEAVRKEMGLDKPLHIQYLIWIGKVFRGDLGTSYVSDLPVIRLLSLHLPATAELAMGAILFALIVAIPAGVIAAVKQRSLVNYIITTLNSLAIAFPNFWLGIMLILLFALVLGWFPPSGRYGMFFSNPAISIKFLVLPVITLGLFHSGILTRFVRSSMLEILNEDYVRTARSKGLTERIVVLKHALKNALIPLVTVTGLTLARMLGGAVVVESVFSWPGLGRMTIDALGNRDYSVVQGAMLFFVTTFIMINLIVDLLYAVLDPRIRLR